jgi:hypothetical protein
LLFGHGPFVLLWQFFATFLLRNRHALGKSLKTIFRLREENLGVKNKPALPNNFPLGPRGFYEVFFLILKVLKKFFGELKQKCGKGKEGGGVKEFLAWAPDADGGKARDLLRKIYRKLQLAPREGQKITKRANRGGRKQRQRQTKIAARAQPQFLPATAPQRNTKRRKPIGRLRNVKVRRQTKKVDRASSNATVSIHTAQTKTVDVYSPTENPKTTTLSKNKPHERAQPPFPQP